MKNTNATLRDITVVLTGDNPVDVYATGIGFTLLRQNGDSGNVIQIAIDSGESSNYKVGDTVRIKSGMFTRLRVQNQPEGDTNSVTIKVWSGDVDYRPGIDWTSL